MIRTWAITRQLWHLGETAVLLRQIRQNRFCKFILTYIWNIYALLIIITLRSNSDVVSAACSILSRRSSGSSLGLPSSATLLQDDDKATVVLLGTVHFSKQSVEDVSQVGFYLFVGLKSRPQSITGTVSFELTYVRRYKIVYG